jgi:hypothetical protein
VLQNTRRRQWAAGFRFDETDETDIDIARR